MIHSSNHRRAGFTLIELLVVLAILAALSTVALRSVHGLQDRARFEATTQRLEDIEAALLGSRSGLPGEVRAGGLIADTGRFLDDGIADPTMRFADLLQQPAGVGLSHLALDTGGDPDVRLATGWRGPYIRTPIGLGPTLQVEDGWGNPMQALFDGTRWSIVSAGADASVGAGTGYDADVSFVLPAGVGVAELQGTVTIEHLADTPVAPTYAVVAFEPDLLTGQLKPIEAMITSTSTDLTALPTTFTFEFSVANGRSLSTGPRILRAYVGDGVTGAALRADSEAHKSRLMTLELLHRSQNVELTISQ